MKKLFFFSIVFILCNSCITVASAMDAYYDRLINQDKFKQLDKPTVNRIQQNLSIIYRNDRDWNRDVALKQHPLTDGLMGPVTLFWLQRFIFDFKIEPIGNYINEIKVRLEQIASFTPMFPEEAKVLISTDFAHWNDKQPELQKSYYYTVRRNGSDQALLELVDLYLRVVDPSSAPVRTGSHELITHYYQLTAEDLKILQGKEQIYEQLSKLVNKQFENVSALKDAVTEALKDYPELVDKLLPVIQQYYRYADPMISQSFLDILMGDPLFTSLNSVITTLLDKTISGVSYPDKDLFDKAIKSKIYAGIGACQDRSNENKYLSRLKISDEDFKKLIEDLRTGPYQGMRDFSHQLNQIDSLRLRQKDACNVKDLEQIDQFVAGLYEYVIQPSIALLYKKTPVYSANKPIQWNGDGCGCVLDNLSGTVYGFYPFWLANGEVQAINFSVLSRVAYYGLSFDEKGIIKQTNNAHNDPTILSANDSDKDLQNGFIQIARKHNSKVDWVIHNDKSYWDQWRKLTYPSRVAVFETLAENIVSLLTSQITNSFSDIKQNMTLGALPPPTRGDGVTLYFNGYPDDLESIEIFNRFFEGLQNKLNARGDDYFTNIMVLQSAIGTGIYRYSNLLERIDNAGFSNSAQTLDMNYSRDDLKSRILVLIEEPTTDSKKKLRRDVENGELHGIERDLLLKNIIPVIEFDGKNWKQLEDDVVYIKRDFGGIGFWPLVVNEPAITEEMPPRCEEMRSVTGCLIRYFQDTTWQGQPDSFINQFVCENRAYFRIAMGLLTVLCLLFTCLYFYSCRIHSRIKNLYILYLFVIVIPTLIVVLLLLTFDPVLEPISEGNLPLIIVLFSGVAISIIVYQRRRKHMKKPSRPRIQISQEGSD